MWDTTRGWKLKQQHCGKNQPASGQLQPAQRFIEDEKGQADCDHRLKRGKNVYIGDGVVVCAIAKVNPASTTDKAPARMVKLFMCRSFDSSFEL